MKGVTLRAIALGMVLAMAAGSASATSLGGLEITGALTFSGDLEPGVNLGTTTSLTFPGGDFGVDQSSGDLGSVSPGDLGLITDFTFDLADGLTIEVGDFSFVADALSVAFQSSAFLILEGSGVLSAAGFNDTAATFSLTSNANGTLRNFSAGIAAAPVPVPGALVLFGSALAALGWRRRA